VKILFVCMGNICRSPTAEAVMRKLAGDAGVALELDSAGTGDWHVGELPDERSRAAAAKRGYQLTHRARQFTAADFARFDLIVVMDRENLAHVQRLGRGATTPVQLLRHYETDPDEPPRVTDPRDRDSGRDLEVPDPYAGGSEGFDRVLDICERACRGLLEHVRDADRR
jgi:protein-tyrosine phosphatase